MVSLVDGYQFWVAAYPHDTTNSKPRVELNKVTEVPGGLEGGLGSSSGGLGALKHSARASIPSAEQLRDLTWLPHSFETKVRRSLFYYSLGLYGCHMGLHFELKQTIL